ncbi:MAG TPA: flagellar motor protein MotB, partial [Deltaproteobacteria bacterium]|nr:flagellar motor protein MotB [Deltaproteobacteria bacterium]
VIIIKKGKKGGHEGGHGGAWKVAYADFVTAMMALFIVLWIVGQNDKVKNSVAQYFKDPGAFHTTSRDKSGILPDSQTVNPLKSGLEQDDAQANEILKLRTEGAELTKAIKNTPALEKLKDKVDITVTKEGLRIDLVEESEGLFFDIGSATLKPEAVGLLRVIGTRIGKMPNHLVIEGHTDSRPYSRAGGYSNWELSSDRANAARRVLEQNGLSKGQCVAVNGFADRRLKTPGKPLDFSNRRTSILVAFSKPSPTDDTASTGQSQGSPSQATGQPAVQGKSSP